MAQALSHSRFGEGHRAILLFHGYLGSRRNLQTLAKAWSAAQPQLSLFIVDLLGHGDSPHFETPLAEKATLEEAAKAGLGLMDALQLEKAELVGHSMGGRVALKMLDLAPQRILALTLLDISPGPLKSASSQLDPVVRAFMDAPSSADSRTQMRTFFVERGISPALTDWLLMNLRRDGEGLVWKVDRAGLEAFRENASGEDLWPALQNAQEKGIPCQCIRGAESAFVSDEDTLRLQALGATVHTLENAGHFVHVDALQDLLDLLLQR